jgi:hypothetical protein
MAALPPAPVTLLSTLFMLQEHTPGMASLKVVKTAPEPGTSQFAAHARRMFPALDSDSVLTRSMATTTSCGWRWTRDLGELSTKYPS